MPALQSCWESGDSNIHLQEVKKEVVSRSEQHAHIIHLGEDSNLELKTSDCEILQKSTANNFN